MYPLDTFAIKKSSLFSGLFDFPISLLPIVSPLVPVHSVRPRVPPSGSGTIGRGWPANDARWPFPDAPVQALTGNPQLPGQLHFGKPKLLADPVKLSSIHWLMLPRIDRTVQVRYMYSYGT
jgi:hypothetical protein